MSQNWPTTHNAEIVVVVVEVSVADTVLVEVVLVVEIVVEIVVECVVEVAVEVVDVFVSVHVVDLVWVVVVVDVVTVAVLVNGKAVVDDHVVESFVSKDFWAAECAVWLARSVVSGECFLILVVTSGGIGDAVGCPTPDINGSGVPIRDSSAFTVEVFSVAVCVVVETKLVAVVLDVVSVVATLVVVHFAREVAIPSGIGAV